VRLTITSNLSFVSITPPENWAGEPFVIVAPSGTLHTVLDRSRLKYSIWQLDASNI
jgi:hypothetical protein